MIPQKLVALAAEWNGTVSGMPALQKEIDSPFTENVLGTRSDASSPIGDLSAAFEFAMHQHEFEITQLTQRNNFFMIFQGVLIAGLIQSQGTAAAMISFALCLLGFVVSLLQVGMAAGSKYWQVRWERAAKTTEIWLLES